MAMTSLLMAFMVIGGLVVGAIYVSNTSKSVTVNSIENGSFKGITPNETVLEPETLPNTVIIDTAQILQNPELPNGCEITALASALAASGYQADKLMLADEYLPQSETYWGADPEKIFMGNPRHFTATPGGCIQDGYCYEEPILVAANQYLAEQDSAMIALAENLNGAEVLEKLASGVPVISWVTTDMSEPLHSPNCGWNDKYGRWFIPYMNVHCVLIIGYNIPLNEVAVMDPLAGFRTEELGTFFSVYELMGSRSVTIEYNARRIN